MIGERLSLEDWRLIVAALAVAYRKKNNGLTLTDEQRDRCRDMARELAAETGKYKQP